MKEFSGISSSLILLLFLNYPDHYQFLQAKKKTIFLCNLSSLDFNFKIGKFLYTCPPTSFGKNGACRLTHIALQKSASPIMQRVIHCRLEKLNFGRIDIVTQKPGNNRIKYQVRNTEERALI